MYSIIGIKVLSKYFYTCVQYVILIRNASKLLKWHGSDYMGKYCEKNNILIN